jgi:hypothetical protein
LFVLLTADPLSMIKNYLAKLIDVTVWCFT